MKCLIIRDIIIMLQFNEVVAGLYNPEQLEETQQSEDFVNQSRVVTSKGRNE